MATGEPNPRNVTVARYTKTQSFSKNCILPLDGMSITFHRRRHLVHACSNSCGAPVVLYTSIPIPSLNLGVRCLLDVQMDLIDFLIDRRNG